jgi:hypothetical protein
VSGVYLFGSREEESGGGFGERERPTDSRTDGITDSALHQNQSKDTH